MVNILHSSKSRKTPSITDGWKELIQSQAPMEILRKSYGKLFITMDDKSDQIPEHT